MSGIGVDMVEVKRFRALKRGAGERFLTNTFSDRERNYCLSFKDSAPHFAGTFAAKEAVQKALNEDSPGLSELEIRRDKSGQPQVWMRGKRARSVHVSITHIKTLACAVAVSLRL